MKKRLLFAILMITLLAQFPTSSVFAMGGEPMGGCAPGFTLEMAMDHENHHHKHVGTTDLNGDGYVCMKHVTPDGKIHVHVDNNLP